MVNPTQSDRNLERCKVKQLFFSAPRVACVAQLMAVMGLLLACTAAGSQTPELTGVWRIDKPVMAIRTVDGKEPPLRPEAAKRYREHQAMRRRGDTSFDSATWCASPGIPRLMFIGAPFEIMVRPQHVAFLHQWNGWTRVVYFNPKVSADTVRVLGVPASLSGPSSGEVFSAPPANADVGPMPMGFSRGNWQGDTLVIETSGLLDSTLIDNAGLPHSSDLKLVERLRLRSPDMLENRIRFEDAKTFTQSWETVVTYRRQPGARIREDVCLDRIQRGEPAVKE